MLKTKPDLQEDSPSLCVYFSQCQYKFVHHFYIQDGHGWQNLCRQIIKFLNSPIIAMQDVTLILLRNWHHKASPFASFILLLSSSYKVQNCTLMRFMSSWQERQFTHCSTQLIQSQFNFQSITPKNISSVYCLEWCCNLKAIFTWIL